MLVRLTACLFALALAACARGDSTPAAQTPGEACRSSDVHRALQAQASVAVIVMLKDGDDPRARQDRVLGDLGADFQLERRYESIPGVAGTITRAGYARAQQHADVRCVQFDGTGGGA